MACWMWAVNRPQIMQTLDFADAHRFDGMLSPFFLAHAGKVRNATELYDWMHLRTFCAPLRPSDVRMSHEEAYGYRLSLEIVLSVRP
jgi:hypothetical protein